MTMNDIIVGMGEALWDVLPEGKKIGGAPANFAYHVSQFGFDSRVVSAVGEERWDGTISLLPRLWKNWRKKRVRYVLVRWHSAAWFPEKQFISFWM